MKRVAIISGASSGIGKSIALILASNGIIVYAGSRNIENNQELISRGVNVKNLDVSSNESVKEFVNHVLNKEKTIDILINNAGYDIFGPVETVSIEEAKKEFDVNLFGVARMSKNIIPVMRKQKNGLIINISSVVGITPLPFVDWYVASKFALEGLSDCMRMELKPFNIKVVKIEPGVIKTPLADKFSEIFMKNMIGTAYEKDAKSFFINSMNHIKDALESIDVAKLILNICNDPNPKATNIIGKDAESLVYIKNNFSDEEYDLKTWGINIEK